MIDYKLVARANAYGFGSDWTLIMKKNGKVKSFWLGQDVKVMRRLLGMTKEQGAIHYKKKANSSNFDIISHYIASDILRKILNVQRLDQDKLEIAWSMNEWDMSVE